VIVALLLYEVIEALSVLQGVLRGGVRGWVRVGAAFLFLLLVIHYVERRTLVLHHLCRHIRLL
jgi:hypothetical protein